MAKLTEEEKVRLRIALQKNLDRNKLFKGMTKAEKSAMKFKDPDKYGVPTALDSMRYKAPKSQKWIVVDPNTGKEHSFSDSTNAQNYIKLQTKKMNEPKKPTAKERKIEKQLKLGGSYVDPDTGFSTRDSLMAAGAFIPERFKTPKKPKLKTEEQLYNERKKELDFILASPSLPEEDRAFYENEMTKLEDSKFNRLTKGKKTAKKISNIDQKDDPSTIEKIFNWGANKWKKSVSDSQWVSARRKYWQGEGLKSLSLSDEEIKSIKGNDNGYTWALKKAKEDFEIKKENEGKVFVDANGIKAKMVNGKWVEVD